MHTAADENSRGFARIVVDDRESRSQVIERLKLQPHVQLEVRRLSVGDYEVGTEWVFERKTIHDFAASLADGRLFHQVARLARCPNGSALILEGPDQVRAETGISPGAWQGTLISIGLAFRLPVIRSAARKKRRGCLPTRQIRLGADAMLCSLRQAAGHEHWSASGFGC
ncbi:MAG: ERCC4 domain-containing protein [Verrucomicrobiota bacterium]|nr:ERCC4 domain-containing protein [Verrucomicrobiota bacterium]